jgi:two-component system cell cycle sensor histidine kinase/response regulator CckA
MRARFPPMFSEENTMQKHNDVSHTRQFTIRQLRLTAILAWTVLAVITAIWEYDDNSEFKTFNALSMARVCIEKDLVFRRWAARHGGVYVPITRDTPPNPWLNVPERDITTPSGRHLTLMNPAYMSRQIFEIGQTSRTAPQGHITSLKVIRPENAPDPWEAHALASFEAGLAEYGESVILNGKPVYRYMRPLMTEKPCLKCHATQGYREGAVRGGISIAIPTAGLEQAMLHSNMNHVAIIAVIWLMGLGGIMFGFRRIGADAAVLTAERDNLSAVFDATPMPMMLFDDRMEVVRVNAAFRDYCTDYDALPDKRCGTLLKCINTLSDPLGCGNTPACDSCALMRALREVSRSGMPARGEAPFSLFKPDGHMMEAWLIYGVEAVSLNDRRHALLSFMDITERKRMEEKMAAREQEFRALVENSPDAVARYDRLCRRVYVNPALERLSGQSADCLTGKTPVEVPVGPPDASLQVQDTVEQVRDRGIPLDIELSGKDSGGVLRYFQVRFVPEFKEDREVASVLSITREITELRRAEDQLRQAQKMESIGTLAGGVAHDFNNLLAVIGGYAELLYLSLNGDEQKQAFVREISDSVNRGAELTRSLLTFSGKHEPQMRYDDLNLIVANLRKSMSRLLRSDITLTFDMCDDRLPVFADRVQIEQVLINLMVNARDALTAGGRIQVSTTLVEVRKEMATGGATVAPGCYGLVTVADDGDGMDEKTLGRIFEPFFTTKETGKGTGLGLAIAFGIVGNHNGRISVNSAPGKGAAFGVYLPIFHGNILPEQSPEQEVDRLRGDETVLLADDEPNVLRMTREILIRYGYRVLTAVDGVDALEVFEAHRDEIRVAVIDMIMPRMNGQAAIEEIRREHPGLPVILTSGFTEDVVDRSVFEALGVVFLQKPVQACKLVETIRAGLDRDV